MANSIITEIVEFGILDSVTDSDFAKIAEEIPNFYRSQPGYIDTEILKNSDGLWVMVLHWESVDAEKKASTLMMKSQETEMYRKSLDLSKFKKRLFNKVIK